ncbi:MAG TPA: hypothetical protein ENK26_02475 [Gammaproteobacteria bacterium]|nr:hypothetical protein [Gammaproteobacteria bacterium]
MTDDPQRHIEQQVDALLLDFGRYEPLELLQREGRLLYADYEAWRGGELETLDEALMGETSAIRRLLDHASAYAARLGLSGQRESYSGWGAEQGGALRIHSDRQLEQAIALVWRPAEDRPQMDLFMDSPATTLANGVRDALLNRDPVTARQRLEQLYDVEAGYLELPGLERLVEALEQADKAVEDIDQALDALQSGIAPLAADLLKRRVQDYLAPLWRRLAAALDGVPFDPQSPDRHASHALAQLQDWRGVREVIEQTPGWRRQPLLLARHSQACTRLNDEPASQQSVLLLCWRFPEQAAGLLADYPSALMRQAWADFEALPDELESELFPAWLLIRYPALAKSLPMEIDGCEARGVQAYRLVHQLQQQRGQALDDEQIDLRKALQAESPALLARYMRDAAIV